MLSSLFIARPKMAIVISTVLTIMGMIAYFVLPVEQFPEITPPVVEVSATYTGANAETVENTVAAPIEAQVNGVDDMIYMSSNSTDTGSYSLSVTFEVGTNPDIASVNVQNRVAQAMATLPSEVTDSGVVTQKASTNMLLLAVLYSPESTYDEVFLSNYATINLKDALSRVKGVGKAEVLTDFEYAMRMWMDPDRMAGLGITPGDLINAIREQNLEVSAGQIGTPPVPEGQQFQYTITSKGRLTTADEFSNIIIRTGDAGSIVRIRDVARVELGAAYYNASGRFEGQPATVLSIYQAPGENALAVSEGVLAELERLSRTFPDDVVYEVPFNTTDFVQKSLEDVITTLMLTFVLVVSVVFFFLGNLRATVIPTVAIPVSLIGTMAFLLAFGMSLNTISLFALVLAIGIVVDDAIVVVENVERIIAEEGLSAAEATRKAMTQITTPVIATTLVLLAVFLPVTLMPGISGRLFSQFAVTISVAVVISSVNALTLSPALCALILKLAQPAEGTAGCLRRDNRAGSRTAMSPLRRLVRSAMIGLAILIALMIGAGGLMRTLPGGFSASGRQRISFRRCAIARCRRTGAHGNGRGTVGECGSQHTRCRQHGAGQRLQHIERDGIERRDADRQSRALGRTRYAGIECRGDLADDTGHRLSGGRRQHYCLQSATNLGSRHERRCRNEDSADRGRLCAGSFGRPRFSRLCRQSAS